MFHVETNQRTNMNYNVIIKVKGQNYIFTKSIYQFINYNVLIHHFFLVIIITWKKCFGFFESSSL